MKLKRKFAPIIVVMATFIAVISMLVYLKEDTQAGDIKELHVNPAKLSPIDLVYPDGAGLFVDPPRQGALISAGESHEFTFSITNAGDAISDTFDIEIDSVWLTELFMSDGSEPLSDTNNDGRIDTSPLFPGQTLMLIARISAPPSSLIGDDNRSMLTVTSANDSLVEETALFQSAIPSSFSQVFKDNGLQYPNVFLAQANYQLNQDIKTPAGRGSEIAIEETIAGYVYVWSHQRLEGNHYVTEIESMSMDKDGNQTSAFSKITNHSEALLSTHDVNPTVAVDLAGNIGISWQRLQFDHQGRVNNNVFAQILDKEGSPVNGAINLSNNTQWGQVNDMDLPDFDSPRISALAESGFFAAWQVERQVPEGSIQDIFYTAIDANGEPAYSPVNLTNDQADADGNVAPALAGLSTDRTLLTWIIRRADDDDLYFVVIDKQGDIVHGPKNISADETVTDWWNFDAVELSNGSIMVVWQAWGCIEGEFTGRIRFVVLGSNYRRIGKPTCMGPEGLAVAGDKAVSVTADAYDNGIITWTDHDSSERTHLYYSLIDKRGNIVTEPLAFYRSVTSDKPISLNAEGSASTSRSFIDGVASFSDSQYFVQKGQPARVTIRYGNLGTLASGALTFTATLNDFVSYTSDTSPVDPTINGNEVIWDFSELEPAEKVEFDLYSTLPASATIGTKYPVSITVGLQMPESNPSNNGDSAQIILIHQPHQYLPLVYR